MISCSWCDGKMDSKTMGLIVPTLSFIMVQPAAEARFNS
jgi:hypothetical protein